MALLHAALAPPSFAHTPAKVGASKRIARAASSATVGLGVLVLFGWIFDLRLLQAPLEGLPSMKANTAFAFILGGTALSLQIEPPVAASKAWLARLNAWLLLAITLATLAEWLLHRSFGIDQLFFADLRPNVPTAPPGRPAPNTALGMLLLALALLWLDHGQRALRNLGQACAIAAMLIAFVAIVGYAYRASALIGVPGYSSMALHTAAGLIVLASGLLAARPERGLAAVIAQGGAAGAVARRMLLAVFAVPLTFGFVILKGEDAQVYDLALGGALLVTMCSWLLAALVLWNGRIAGALDAAQQQAFRDQQRATRARAEQFERALEASTAGMILIDAHGAIVLVNAEVEKQFGYPRRELIGKPVELLVPERHRPRHARLRSAFFAEPAPRTMAAGRELSGRRKDGSELPIEIGLNPLETAEGGFVLASVLDITERRRAEAEREQLIHELRALSAELEQRVEQRTGELDLAHFTLAQSESRYRALFHDSPISLWELDFTPMVEHLESLQLARPELRLLLERDRAAVMAAIARAKILACNQSTLVLFEAEDERELRDALPRLFGPEAADYFRQQLLAYLDGRTSHSGEMITSTVKGRRIVIGARLSVVPGHEASWSRAIVSLFDVTAHRDAERRLTASLREKEVLLKEVHHRVKNNLQVISSLLNLQADLLGDPSARAMFTESQSRVASIALVHEQLYRSKHLDRVDFDEYIHAVAESLLHSLNGAERGIDLTIDTAGVNLPVDVAIPCGLIINELVTNALKHAFPTGRTGRVGIHLRRCEDGRLELCVEDDGIGLAPEIDPVHARSLGLELVFAFADQLDAESEVRREHGTGFCFRFAQTR